MLGPAEQRHMKCDICNQQLCPGDVGKKCPDEECDYCVCAGCVAAREAEIGSDHEATIGNVSAVAADIPQTEAIVRAIIELGQSRGEHIAKSQVIKQLDEFGLENVCSMLERKFGARPKFQLDVSPAEYTNALALAHIGSTFSSMYNGQDPPDLTIVAQELKDKGIGEVCSALEQKYQCTWPAWRAWIDPTYASRTFTS